MQIVQMRGGPLGVNIYAVSGEGSKTCVVIDPGCSEKPLRYLKESGLTLEAILVTHGHFDHVWGAKKLHDATGAPVYCHRLDAPKLTSDEMSQAALIGRPMDLCEVSVFPEDGEELLLAGLRFRVLFTPGHSEGGVCYAVDSAKTVFCGDTVFYESVGRTDFPGCSYEALAESVRTKLLPLPEDTVLYPGHGESTTLAHEKRFNPYIRMWMQR